MQKYTVRARLESWGFHLEDLAPGKALAGALGDQVALNTQRPAEPRWRTLISSSSRPGLLDEVVNAEVVLSRVLEDGEALACCAVEGLFMECGFGHFV